MRWPSFVHNACIRTARHWECPVFRLLAVKENVPAAAQIEVEGTGTLEAKSPATTVKGDGTLTLKGGMVAIN